MYQAFAAHNPKESLVPFSYQPEPLSPTDVEIEIECCGLCYSDVHLIDNDWNISNYPLVPGHEIIGRIIQAGPLVKELKVGSRVGVGWQCGACLTCDSCLSANETSCPSKIRTCVDRAGGFANKICVDHSFVCPIPSQLKSIEVAPLLCAGITTYSPFRIYQIQAPQSVAVIGIGGLGHLALQFARAFGCEVTAISSSPEKEPEARLFGAHHFLPLSTIKPGMTPRFDFILSTVHADIDWTSLMQLLKPQGKLCFVGLPPSDFKIPARLLISGNKMVCGSGTGSRSYMKEMLQFAAFHRIQPQVETMAMQQLNEAIAKLKKKSSPLSYRAYVKLVQTKDDFLHGVAR